MDEIVSESKNFVLVDNNQCFPCTDEGNMQFLNWLESYLEKGMEFASALPDGVLFRKTMPFLYAPIPTEIELREFQATYKPKEKTA